MRKNPPAIFVSYSPETKPIATFLMKMLEEENIKCFSRRWTDLDKVVPTDELLEQTEAALRNSSVFIVVFSLETLGNPDVSYEIGAALCRARILKNGAFIPIFLGESEVADLPSYLQKESPLNGNSMRFREIEDAVLRRVSTLYEDVDLVPKARPD